MQLKATFAAFVISGVGVIFLMSARVGDAADPSQQFTMIGIVVALMFVYGLYLWQRSSANLATEADGETFYYLGFIFTLATLVATFMPLLWTTGKPDSKHVLGLFGLGLITTFVGLAGRIVFSQFADPLDDGENALRRVARAAEEAAQNIEAVSLQIRRSGEQMESGLKEGHGRLIVEIERQSQTFTAQLARYVEQSSRSMEQVTAVSTTRISELMDVLEERLGAIRLPPKELSEQLSAEITMSVGKLSALSAGLNESTVRLKEAGLRFSEASKAAAQAKDHFENLGGAAQGTAASMQAVAQAADKSQGAFDRVSQSVDDVEAGVRQGQLTIGKAVTDITADMDKGRAAWTSFVDASISLQDQVRQLAISAETLLKVVGAVAAAAAEAQKATLAFSEGASGLANAARLGSGATNELMDRNAEAVKKFGELMVIVNTHQAQLQKLAATISADISASQEAVRKVHKQLVASASFIVQKLE